MEMGEAEIVSHGEGAGSNPSTHSGSSSPDSLRSDELRSGVNLAAMQSVPSSLTTTNRSRSRNPRSTIVGSFLWFCLRSLMLISLNLKNAYQAMGN